MATPSPVIIYTLVWTLISKAVNGHCGMRVID
jgi:hypothetical protein